jgi:MFS family permease
LAGASVCFVQTSLSLLLCRILGGVAAAAWVPFAVHFSLYFKAEQDTRAMGIINAVNSTGQVLAVLLCGVVLGLGPAAPFVTAVFVALAALVMSFFIREPDKSPFVSGSVSLRALSKVPFEHHLLLLSILGLFSQYMTFATLYGFTPIIAKGLKATNFQVSLLLTLFILPAIVSSAISGPLSDKFGGRLVLTINFVLFALDCLLTPFVPSVASLFILTIIGGFAQGLIFPLLMGYVVKSISAEKRNTAMGFYQAVYGLGMFLGPTIVGIFSNSLGIVWGFVFTALIGFIAAGLSLKMPGKTPLVLD